MKKTLLTILAGTAFAVSAMAQGSVNFDNYVLPSADKPIYGPDPGSPTTSHSGQSSTGVPAGSTVYPGALLVGSQYVAELYFGPLGTTDANVLTMVTSSTFTSTIGPGYWAEVDNVVLNGFQAGDKATLQVRVWDTQSGSSFATATSKGQSALFSSPTLGGTDSDGNPVITGDTARIGAFTSFNITSAVPEPSTFALAGLGAAALLIFRRRK